MKSKNIRGKTIGGTVLAAVLAIIATVVSVEGGYVDNPNDPGGKTNHGITEEVARNNGYTGDMRTMTQDQAKEILVGDYVVKPGFLPIVEVSEAVGEELIDTGVNAGPGRSARWFQRAVNQLNSGTSGCGQVAVDGAIGPRSVEAYRCLVRTRGAQRACQMTIKLMDAQQAGHYMALVDQDPKFRTFIVGWVDHRIGNVRLDKC